ncbi:uncharacterized protein EV154DRAFT_484229 [Mucor mucedo]|uniref:uncharacterized protein n=1 Tax=Mucor mucedo TaxID=29922 RepID=UPI00221FCA67|nr:uncharacterized protein EV154DRAFT_484229 [Mucor mucedo]KAI7888265.1 hypothetical protein EV154DRAFT_484229 [Mucor mucedo]
MSSNNNTGSPNSGLSNADLSNSGSVNQDVSNPKVKTNLGTSASRYATAEVESSKTESSKAKSVTKSGSRKGKEKAPVSVSEGEGKRKATASGGVFEPLLESEDSSGDTSRDSADSLSEIGEDDMDIDPLDMSDLEESQFVKTSLACYRVEVGRLTKDLVLRMSSGHFASVQLFDDCTRGC